MVYPCERRNSALVFPMKSECGMHHKISVYIDSLFYLLNLYIYTHTQKTQHPSIFKPKRSVLIHKWLCVRPSRITNGQKKRKTSTKGNGDQSNSTHEFSFAIFPACLPVVYTRDPLKLSSQELARAITPRAHLQPNTDA